MVSNVSVARAAAALTSLRLSETQNRVDCVNGFRILGAFLIGVELPTQGVGGAAQPPDDSTDTPTPTPTTFGVSMGHPGQVTPLQQYTYGYLMQMPMMPMHQMNHQ